MSYVIDQAASSEGDRRRRRWPWVLLAVVVLALVATGAFLLGRGDSGPGGAAPRPNSPVAPPPVDQGPLGPLEWRQFAGSPLPRSAQHGPREEIGGVARGYSHDEAGAVLAAINLAVRGSSAAGPGTYESVLRAQGYGDVDLALNQLVAQSSTASAQETQPLQWWYAIKAGNPRGDLVEVSLVARTAQADGMGGYAQMSRTLAWRDGDWKMQVPVSPPSLAVSTAGYTPLGGPR